MASGKPLTGRTVLFCLIAFFGVVFGANAVMIKLAIDTLPGTEVDSAYKASLAYNAEIRAADIQAGRAWSVVGRIERRADGQAIVRVEARDAAKVPLSGLAFSVRMSRPADQRGDRVAPLSEHEAGLYRGQIFDLAAGQWDVVLEASRGDERLFLSRNRMILQ
jgi:nitrogen fixation protein FixH